MCGKFGFQSQRLPAKPVQIKSGDMTPILWLLGREGERLWYQIRETFVGHWFRAWLVPSRLC